MINPELAKQHGVTEELANEFDASARTALEELLVLQEAMIDKALAGGTDDWTPTLLVSAYSRECTERTLTMFSLMMPFNEHGDKHRAMEFAGKQVAARNEIPLAICLSTEAWVSDNTRERGYAMPADDPERREAIVAFATSIVAAPACRIHRLFVERGKGNRLVRVGDWDRNEEARTTSPLLMSFWKGYYEAKGGKVHARN